MSEEFPADVDPETGMPSYPEERTVQKEMHTFRVNFVKAKDGSPALVLLFEMPAKPGFQPEQLFFMISGEELVKFFQYVKMGITGNKVPDYLR